MLDTDAVRVQLEHRSHLDQWFTEQRCSLLAIVAGRYSLWFAASNVVWSARFTRV